MYITYENRQYRSLKLYLDLYRNWHATPPGWTFDPPPESEFKPSFLVRVSDMQKIRGYEADEGYYALSYSWNQSGDIFKDGDEYRRTDDGRHKIVSYGITEESSKLRRLFKFLTRKSEYVKFEGLIQRICQDFGVKYIWYDQICINQLDPEDKKRELRQMHRIYGNAHCTIALVPDLEVDFWYHEWPKRRLWSLNGIRDKQWAKRLWTLEEAAMSKRMLFVGRNIHLWSHPSAAQCFGSHDDAFVRQICDRSIPWNAHSVLWHAHRRTSTKAHDRIFAIANIFPDIVDEIDFNYSQPLLDLTMHFYCLLVQKDLSVLCFGAPIHWINDSIIETPEDVLLPSWTGSRGIHIRPSDFKTEFRDYCVIGTSLQVNCSYTHISIEPLVKFKRKGPKFPIFCTFSEFENSHHQQGETTKHRAFLGVSKPLRFVAPKSSKDFPYDDYLLHHGVRGTYYLPMKQEADTTWINTPSSPSEYCGYLSLTEECTDCVILSGIRFIQGVNSSKDVYPVVRPNGNYYKSIGVCVMPNFLFKNIEEAKQTFIIK